jgi:hypothetical protein
MQDNMIKVTGINKMGSKENKKQRFVIYDRPSGVIIDSYRSLHEAEGKKAYLKSKLGAIALAIREEK